MSSSTPTTFRITFHCSFCEQDDIKNLTTQQLNSTQQSECPDCFRKMTIISSILLDSNSNSSSPQSPTQLQGATGGINSPSQHLGVQQHQNAIMGNNNVAQDLVTRILTSVSNSMLSNTPNPSNRRNQLAGLSLLIQRALVEGEIMGEGFEDGLEGCHPDFLNFLKNSQKEMTPLLFYQITMLTNTYPGLINTTVGEFGYGLDDVIKCLEYKQYKEEEGNEHIEEYIDANHQNNNGDDQNNDRNNNNDNIITPPIIQDPTFPSSKPAPTLSKFQQKLYGHLKLVPYDGYSDSYGIKGVGNIDVPENSYLLYSSTLFQPKPVTGKGLVKDTYRQQYNEYCGGYYGCGDDRCSDSDRSTTTPFQQPPIHTFQRGEVSFAIKSNLIQPIEMYRGWGEEKKDDENKEKSTIMSPIMIVSDINYNWPFIMSDSTKTANNNILALMISLESSKQLGLPGYQPGSNAGEKNEPNLEKNEKNEPNIEKNENTLSTSSSSSHPIEANLLLTAKPQQECSICQCQFECGDHYVTLACKHHFHYNCLLGWVTKKNSCPTCRFKLPSRIAVEDDHEMEIDRRANYQNFFL